MRDRDGTVFDMVSTFYLVTAAPLGLNTRRTAAHCINRTSGDNNGHFMIRIAKGDVPMVENVNCSGVREGRPGSSMISF